MERCGEPRGFRFRHRETGRLRRDMVAQTLGGNSDAVKEQVSDGIDLWWVLSPLSPP